MSEEQKKQAEAILTEVNGLLPKQREAALAYMQGMTAATQLLGVNTGNQKAE